MSPRFLNIVGELLAKAKKSVFAYRIIILHRDHD